VTTAGIAKLTDFGVAQLSGDRSLTSTGAAVGSLHYMSPEQVRGGSVDGRSDIYSVGITLYEITTGRRAIRGDSNWSIMDGHLHQRPTAPVEINPALPRSLSDAILRAIEKSPADRYPTADEFRSALGEDAVTITKLPSFLARTTAATATPAPVDAAQLARLENTLVRAVGPIGKQLVARAAQSHSSLPELCRALATHIPTPKEREEFLRSFARETTPPSPVPAPTPTPPAPTFDAELIRTVKQKLAMFLGPIANIMVDRAARTARSPRELYEALAAQIPQESERQAFLKSLPR
jgi:serine/threonine-protein kinase